MADDMDTLKQIGEYGRAVEVSRRATESARAYEQRMASYAKRVGTYRSQAKRFGQKSYEFSKQFKPFTSGRETRGKVFKTPRTTSKRYLSSQYSIYKGGVAELKTQASQLGKELKGIKTEEKELAIQKTEGERLRRRAEVAGQKTYMLPVKITSPHVTPYEEIASEILAGGPQSFLPPKDISVAQGFTVSPPIQEYEKVYDDKVIQEEKVYELEGKPYQPGVMKEGEVSIGKFKALEAKRPKYTEGQLAFIKAEDVIGQIKEPGAEFIARTGHFPALFAGGVIGVIERASSNLGKPIPKKEISIGKFKEFEESKRLERTPVSEKAVGIVYEGGSPVLRSEKDKGFVPFKGFITPAPDRSSKKTTQQQFEKHISASPDIRKDWVKIQKRGYEYGRYIKQEPVKAASELVWALFGLKPKPGSIYKKGKGYYDPKTMKSLSMDEVFDLVSTSKTQKYTPPKTITKRKIQIAEKELDYVKIQEGQTTLEVTPKFLKDKPPVKKGVFNLPDPDPKAVVPRTLIVESTRGDVIGFIRTRKTKQKALAEYRPEEMTYQFRHPLGQTMKEIQPGYKLVDWPTDTPQPGKRKPLSLWEDKKAQIVMEKPPVTVSPLKSINVPRPKIKLFPDKQRKSVKGKAKQIGKGKAALGLGIQPISKLELKSQLRTRSIKEKIEQPKTKRKKKQIGILKIGSSQILQPEFVTIGKITQKTTRKRLIEKTPFEPIKTPVKRKKRGGLGIPSLKRKKKKFKKTKRGLTEGGKRQYGYTPSLIGIGLPPVKRTKQKEFTGFEVRRVRL